MTGLSSTSDDLSARQLAFLALRAIVKGAFADIELDRRLQSSVLSPIDRGLVTTLVYGSVRRQRTLDALIDQIGRKTAQQQPADLRLILHLGFYQLRYLDHIPDHAVVDTTVELAKQNQLGQLAGVVNGMLRQYLRLSRSDTDPLTLPASPLARLGLRHSYPDWMIAAWQSLLPEAEVEQLCEWFNHAPSLDLRVNCLQISREQLQATLQAADIATEALALVPSALRLVDPPGNLRHLPGYTEGWWTVQDSSAQLVSHLVDPQPGERVIDACAAPGGKATHLTELMGDRGQVVGCDRTAARIRKIQENRQRLQLRTLETHIGDSCQQPQFVETADKVLLDAPCSGLGTLHRHADARWRQTPDSLVALVQLQKGLLAQTATWVKPGGTLVYATCSLHPDENEHQIQHFLADHPQWHIELPAPTFPAISLMAPEGWLKVWPHRQNMDGFFMVKLGKG